MAFRWSDFLSLAGTLALEAGAEIPASHWPPSAATTEACLRIAVSRAYYAAFGEACTYLKTRQPPLSFPTDGSLHQFVIDQFSWHQDKPQQRMAEKLIRLRTARNQADYHLDISDWKEVAETAFFTANRVLNEIGALSD